MKEGKEGTSVDLPYDPANEARALVMLEQFGWIKLKPGYNPITVSEKDLIENAKKIKLVPIEAAQYLNVVAVKTADKKNLC